MPGILRLRASESINNAENSFKCSVYRPSVSARENRAALTYVKKRRVFIGSHTRQTRGERLEKGRTDLV